MIKRIGTLLLATVLCAAFMAPAFAAEPHTKVDPILADQSQLLTVLPSYVSTPDGMAIDKAGDLIVACPNFGDLSMPGIIIRVDKSGKVSKWFDVPVNAATGVARPMGIDFDSKGNLYIVDNQGWTGQKLTQNQGRILKVEFDKNGNPAKTTEIATGMEHPNGIKIRGGYAYVTQSTMEQVEDESGLLVSALYRFPIDADGIQVTNTLEDENIITTFITLNEDVQYGVDGLVFDKEGNLYVGNFGDGAIHKITFENGEVADNTVWAKNPAQLATTDGMCIDDDGNIYVADFSRNAVARVTPQGQVKRIAQSPDSNGLNGELDQPGEPIIWGGKIVVTCFDMVTDDGKINSEHTEPATIAFIDLPSAL